MPFCKHGCKHFAGSWFFLSRGFARKVQEIRFALIFPHIMLYHDNAMSYENPFGLLVTQIHCAGLEGTELFEAACSFLHMSRSVRSGADSIFSTILGHRVAFFGGISSEHVLLWWQLDSGSVVFPDIYANAVTGLALFDTYCMCLKESLSRYTSRNERHQFLRPRLEIEAGRTGGRGEPLLCNAGCCQLGEDWALC